MTLFRILAAAVTIALSTPVVAAEPPKPLFAADTPIQITLQGPIPTLVRNRNSPPVAATLKVGAETLPVTLSPRGITRRKAEICAFPPLRVEFTAPPPPMFTRITSASGQSSMISRPTVPPPAIIC